MVDEAIMELPVPLDEDHDTDTIAVQFVDN
jgi:hypothetical protein